MYSDFFQLLQADAHPDITIRFYYDPYKLLNPGAAATSISSEIWVSLAGEEKKFRLPGTVHVCYDNAAHLNGSLKIDLRDFNLTPPTKFMGMVKVNNEVSVEFAVRMFLNLLHRSRNSGLSDYSVLKCADRSVQFRPITICPSINYSHF